jgi:predicted dehydrogenase
MSGKTEGTSRREFSKGVGAIAAAALAGMAVPSVHAASSDLIQLALVGCGGRGTGAAGDALSTRRLGPIKVVAMADVFENKLKGSYANLSKNKEQVDVPPERQFLGFDGYKKAMDCLKPGDVVILATPPAFRWVQFTYAIEKGLNVFMEKPVTVDGPTTKRMFALADEADKKNLKVGVGLMVRHCRGRQEMLKRIQDGEIGEIIAMRGYRMSGASATARPKPANTSELMFQIRSFHSWLWASGGLFSDYYIHQIDECSWIKGAWPVSAHALGGRHNRGTSVDQNLDIYAVEYTFPDGTKFFYNGRHITGCKDEFASYAIGSKGSCVITTSSHAPGRVRTFKGYDVKERKNMIWAFPEPEPNPYQMEWVDLITAIRNNEKYNEAKRGAEASLVTSMGRMAAHTGQIITFEQMLNCPHEFAPDVDKLVNADSPAPVQADAAGKYPWPEPGVKRTREY